MIPWILSAVIGLLVLLAITAIIIIRRKREFYKPDYYSMFIMGAIWLPIGVVFIIIKNPVWSFFFILGFIYFAVGLANKDKWKENRRKRDKKLMWIISIILGILVALGLVAYALFR